jgi:hypothetical protein
MHCSGAAAGHGHWVSGPKGVFTFRNEYNSLARWSRHLEATLLPAFTVVDINADSNFRASAAGALTLKKIIIEAHNIQ